MTQEEKELLTKDLCARLPYGVICKRGDYIEKLEGVHPSRVYSIYTEDEDKLNMCHHIEDIKPYLRPMSSMTDEERDEFRKTGGVMSYSPQHDTWAISAFAPEAYDWLNKNKFDYRGLIPMGLALEAPKDMYK